MEFAREFGLSAQVIEKDYTLGWLLAGGFAMKVQILILALAAPVAGQAAVYQCQVDGQTVFTDRSN